MTIDVIRITVICVLAALAYYVNENLNSIPVLKTVVRVVIVVVSVIMLLQSLGLWQGGPQITVQ